MSGEIHHPAFDRGAWKTLLFFPLHVPCEPRVSRSIPCAPTGPGAAVPRSWHHTCLSWWLCSALSLCLCLDSCPMPSLCFFLMPSSVARLLPSSPRVFRTHLPLLSTLHSPGCLSDSVLAVSETAIWILADFTNLCVVNAQKLWDALRVGWAIPVCKHCGLVLCGLGVYDQWWQWCENRQKAQEGFDHTNTKLNNFSVPLELLELMKMWQQRIYTSCWPHMVVPPAVLCSRVQHSSLLIYLHLEQKQGRQGKTAQAPTHHMLFLIIEKGGCAQLSPDTFRGPGACGTTAVVLLFPPVLSPPPAHSAARKLRMLLLWDALGRHLLCEDEIAATYSPPSYTAQCQCQGTWLWAGNCIFFTPKPPAFSTFALIPLHFPDLWLVSVHCCFCTWRAAMGRGSRIISLHYSFIFL